MTTDSNIRREQIRRQIVNIVFFIYWLLIFEGALRKWFFPQYQKYIFFIRDPFVLWVYWLAFSNGMWPRRTHIFLFGLWTAVAFLLLALLQGIITTVGIKTLIYGWRMYFFYMPLAFIIGDQFRGEDLKRLIRQTLLVCIPIAALVYLQYLSPPQAFVNRSAEAEGIVYTVEGLYGGSIVRTTGTFTFFHGQQLFIGSLIAFVFACWVLPQRERPLSSKILLVSTGAAIVNFALSGTRLPFIMAALVCLATALSSFVMRGAKMNFRAKVFPAILIIVGMLFSVKFFSTMYQTTLKRHLGAQQIEGFVIWRGTRMFYNFTDFISQVPFLGTGIGSQTSGGTALASGGRIAIGNIEDEWSRIVAETGPTFGFLYINFRILLVIWLFKTAVGATRRSNNPFPLILVGYIGIIIIIWNTTNYGTENGYAWLFAGFCIATSRLGEKTGETWDMQ